MKLRFAVNQAECLRRGIDAPKSIVTIEVTPAEIPQVARNWIAKRMQGIDVCALKPDGSFQRNVHRLEESGGALNLHLLIKANEPNYTGLLLAVMENEADSESLPKEKREELRKFCAAVETTSDEETVVNLLANLDNYNL